MKIKSSDKSPNCNLYTCLLGSLLLFSPALLLAADDELFFDMPIVLSSNRLEQPVSDAAVSISVIDRETIEASGARTIPEVLRLVPGMQVGFSGNEFGDEPKYVVTYHGHSDQYSRQMQVLVDGRSIYDPFFGGINWKAVPVNINDIERIEVSRGPNLASYGANSFQAAINIITRTAAEDQGSFIQSNIGNNETADLTYRYGGNNGDLDYRITASTYNDAGLDSANEFDYQDDTHSNNIDYRLDYQLNNKNTLSYQGGYGENRQQADRNYQDVIPTERTVNNTQFFQFIKWENSINTENTLQVQYYYNLSDKDERYASDLLDQFPVPPFILEVNADIKSERHNLELTHFIHPSKQLKFIWGTSAQFDHVKSPLFLGTDEKVTNEQYNAFANIEYNINNSNTVNFGALLEKNDFSDTELSPRLSLTHAFNPNHKIRLGVSKAIRSPFILEARASQTFRHQVPGGPILRENVLGSTDYRTEELENEQIISREIAYLGEFLDSSLLFNARFFHDKLSKYIKGDSQTDTLAEPGEILVDDVVHVFRNSIDSRTTGLELELDYYIDPSLRLISSGAIININSRNEAISLSAPQHSFSFLINKKFNEKINGSLAYYYVDRFKWTDAPGVTDDYSTDRYQTLDLRLTRNFILDKSHGSLSVVLKNLLDDYSDYQSDPRNAGAPTAVSSTLAYLDFRLNF